MAHLDLSPATAPVLGIAESHQSTVSVIQRGVRLGLFTAAEADLMIGRVRALAAGSLLNDPNRTV